MDSGFDDGAAPLVTTTIVRVEGMLLPQFQGRRFVGPCVFGLLLLGWCVFGLVPPLRFGTLFPEWKDLCVDFPRPSSWLPHVVRFSRRKVRQVERLMVDDAMVCRVTQ